MARNLYTPTDAASQHLFAALDEYLNDGSSGQDTYLPLHDMMFRLIGGLYCDYYALTMYQSLYRCNLHSKVVGSQVTIRENPFGGSYTVAGGLELAVKFLRNLAFHKKHIEILRRQVDRTGARMFDDDFLHYLEHNFDDALASLNIRAMREGSLLFEYEPAYVVEGHAGVVELIEAMLLNMTNSNSLWFTAATHLRFAMGKSSAFLEGGMRRAQDMMGFGASRAAILCGANATSNVVVNATHGLPIGGTFAHFYVMLHPSEVEAFENYLQTMPGNTTMLVDTEDTLRGVERVINICKRIGITPMAIRLDSGDIAYFAKQTRKILDAAGFNATRIVVSDGLDPDKITQLKTRLRAYEDLEGIKTDLDYLVGTWLAAASESPALGGVFKIHIVRDDDSTSRDVIKIGGDKDGIKTTMPGLQTPLRLLAAHEKGPNPMTLVDGTTAFAAGGPGSDEGERLKLIGKVLVPLEWNMQSGHLPHDVVSVDRSQVKAPVLFRAGTRCINPHVDIVKNGQVVYDLPDTDSIKAHVDAELGLLTPDFRWRDGHRTFVIGVEKGLFEKRARMIAAKRAESA